LLESFIHMGHKYLLFLEAIATLSFAFAEPSHFKAIAYFLSITLIALAEEILLQATG
jgi:hypothetical protein